MLAIARALCLEPKVLLLDEPTEGLAPVIIAQIGATIRMLKQKGFTIILVEQNFRFASKVADRFYLMDHGVMTAEFPVGDLANRMDLLNWELGV